MDIDEIPWGEYAFPGPLRDRLVGAILDGTKTATTSTLLEYRIDDDPLPQAGDLEAVVDSAGRVVCITRTTEVCICRIDEVTVEHAHREGEGYADVAAWRAGHERFWHSQQFREVIGDAGFTVDDSTEVVCTRFELVERLDPPR